MSPVAAPKCQQEGCQNPTWHGYCHHHQSGSNSGSQNTPSVIASQPVASLNFLHYANVSDLWSDLLGAFPDAGDVVQPKTIRQEAIDTLSAAVDNEAYRRFPDLDVPDYEQREALVAQMREQLVNDLLPEAYHVTGSQAKELSYSSSDQYGRSAEDSRYLASFALNAEWECARILGAREDISFEQFVQNVVPEMAEAIDMSFRRNLGEFADIVRQVSNREPLNGAPIAPNLVITPVQGLPLNDAIPGEVVGEPTDEIADWFTRNRQYLAEQPPAQTPPPAPQQQPTVQYNQQGYPDQGYQQYPPQQYYPQGYPQDQYAQQQPKEESVWGSIFRVAKDAAKEYVEDPDGKRLAARKAREDRKAAQQAAEDAQLRRELDKELLKSRKRRNSGGRYW